jgi:hypothetical protein
MNPVTAAPFFTRWFSRYRPLLAPYFDLLAMTLEFVTKSDREDKIFYVDVLRATLSPGELFLLFHYASAQSEQRGEDRLKELCERYGVLEELDPEMYDLPGDRRLWFRVRQERREYADC